MGNLFGGIFSTITQSLHSVNGEIGDIGNDGEIYRQPLRSAYTAAK